MQHLALCVTDWVKLYEYTTGLLCLEFCRPVCPSVTPPELSSVSIPPVASEWREALSTHPDQAFAGYICNGRGSGLASPDQHL